MGYADPTLLRRNLATRAKTTSIRTSSADRIEAQPNTPAVFVLDYTIQITGRPNANKLLSDMTVHGVLLLAKPGRWQEAE